MGPAPKALERWTRTLLPPIEARFTMRTVWFEKPRGGSGVGRAAGGRVAGAPFADGAAPLLAGAAVLLPGAGAGRVAGRAKPAWGLCCDAAHVATQCVCAGAESERAVNARAREHIERLIMG